MLHWSEKHSLWPALKGGDGEEGHHGSEDVVKVELAVLPAPGLYHGLADLPILVGDVVPSVGGECRQNVAHLHRQREALEVGGQPREGIGKAQTHLHSASVCLELSVQLYSLP